MLIVFVALLTALVPLRNYSQVVFSEVMSMGSSGSTADEWVELHNRLEQQVDISGWVITRMTDDSEQTMVAVAEAPIVPRGIFLIAKFPQMISDLGWR